MHALDAISKDNDIKSQQNRIGLCVYQPDWHQGVIGILAARIKEKYHRPTIAFANAGDDEIKGSARSIPGVHIRDVLDTVAARHPELISKFGGHAMAAGLSLPLANYARFTEAFNSVLSDWVKPEDLNAEILSDGELNDEQLNLATAKLVRESGPWGQAFPVPVFDGEFRVIDYRVVGEHHLKMKLQPMGGRHSIDAIAFNFQNYHWDNRADIVYVAYELDVNHFRNIESAQLLVRYLSVKAVQ
jgi:single-stranded-DNA-specific exonuclease